MRGAMNVLLAFDSDIGPALWMACQRDADEDSIHLAKAAEIIRKDILSCVEPFSGLFSRSCQEDSIPSNLLALVSMILEGLSITYQNENHKIPAALAISQLLIFNSVRHKRHPGNPAGDCRRSQSKETPLPI